MFVNVCDEARSVNPSVTRTAHRNSQREPKRNEDSSVLTCSRSLNPVYHPSVCVGGRGHNLSMVMLEPAVGTDWVTVIRNSQNRKT